MTREPDDPHRELLGITRFHKVTIIAGTVFCLGAGLRLFTFWQRTGAQRHLVFAAFFLAAGLALIVYLVRFFRRGIP